MKFFYGIGLQFVTITLRHNCRNYHNWQMVQLNFMIHQSYSPKIQLVPNHNSNDRHVTPGDSQLQLKVDGWGCKTLWDYCQHNKTLMLRDETNNISSFLPNEDFTWANDILPDENQVIPGS